MTETQAPPARLEKGHRSIGLVKLLILANLLDPTVLPAEVALAACVIDTLEDERRGGMSSPR